jgi:outer membrane protein assembly factor BamD
MRRFAFVNVGILWLLLSAAVGYGNNLGAECRTQNAERGTQNALILPPDTNLPVKGAKPVNLYSSSEDKKGTKKSKITFETFEQNYKKANTYYAKGSFLSAAKIYEELYPLSIGLPIADTLLFLFADCYYKNKDYQMAAFHFKDYTRRYPNTERTQLAYLNFVKSVNQLSPEYSLDQYETKYAIDEINFFIQLYPNTPYMEECNIMLDKLRDKLAHKDFEVLKLYYNTENYKACQIAVKNFQKDYSYSIYSDDVLYYLVKNNFEYAKKSINVKQQERYIECTEAFDKLRIFFPDSEFIAEAKLIAENAQKEITKIINKNK